MLNTITNSVKQSLVVLFSGESRKDIMHAVSPQTEFVGVGLYTISEAAKLLRSSPRTIRRWVEGYDYRRNGEKVHSAPLWRPDLSIEDGVELSFRDLIELRFISAFTDLGLSIRTIRSCLDAARECIDSDRPGSDRPEATPVRVQWRHRAHFQRPRSRR